MYIAGDVIDLDNWVLDEKKNSLVVLKRFRPCEIEELIEFTVELDTLLRLINTELHFLGEQVLIFRLGMDSMMWMCMPLDELESNFSKELIFYK